MQNAFLTNFIEQGKLFSVNEVSPGKLNAIFFFFTFSVLWCEHLTCMHHILFRFAMISLLEDCWFN